MTDGPDRGVGTSEGLPGILDAHCPACLGTGSPLQLVVDGRYRLVRCRRCRSQYLRPDPREAPDTVAAAVSEAVSVARSRGLTVCPTDDLDAMLPDRSVDAITLWDVIEHRYDPAPVVGQVLKKPAGGGPSLANAVRAGLEDGILPEVLVDLHREMAGNRLACTASRGGVGPCAMSARV